MMTRRKMLWKLGAGVPLLLGSEASQAVLATFMINDSGLSREDDAFLEELERATFRYFTDCAHPETGLVKDRSHVTGEDTREIASIAATGFGLTGLCIADGRGWLPRGEARQRARTALQFLCERMPHEHGFFYHFVNWRTGEREWKCELSSIDTALLLCGALTCRQHFRDSQIRKRADAIYDRIDWVWMMNGGELLTHGWKPESGFLKSRWDTYCEHMMLYLLAIGARRHPIPATAWDAWKRPWFEYAGLRYITPREPLFVHQYSHAWIDFRGRRDRHADYFENSMLATKAHRAFCVSLTGRFPHFGEDVWGITASDSRKGYVVWGGPPELGTIDGSIVPSAAAGSLPFLPMECVRCLRTLRRRYGRQAWNRYGFADAFNPADGWVGADVIGINAGITLLMAENARTGFIWKTFMKNEAVLDALKKVGFRTAKSRAAESLRR
jgi:hypothetical protein